MRIWSGTARSKKCTALNENPSPRVMRICLTRNAQILMSIQLKINEDLVWDSQEQEMHISG